jgi:hypothetical protein
MVPKEQRRKEQKGVEMSNTMISDEIRMVVDTVRRFVHEKVQPLENEVETLGHMPGEKLNRDSVKVQLIKNDRSMFVKASG